MLHLNRTFHRANPAKRPSTQLEDAQKLSVGAQDFDKATESKTKCILADYPKPFTEEQRTRSMAIQRFNDKINKLNADAGGPDKDKSRSPRAEAAQGSSGNALAPNQNLQKRKQLQSLGCALKGNQTET